MPSNNNIMTSHHTITRLSFALLVPLAAMLLASCSRSVKVEGEIKGLGTQSLRLVHCSPGGAISESYTESRDNKFSYSSPESVEGPVLLALYNAQGMCVVTLALEPGDKAKVTGDMLKLAEIKVDGSDLSKRWRAFIALNSKLYASSDHDKLNAAIEKYVKGHRDDLLSTVLVLHDYTPGSPDDSQKLLKFIDGKAKPSSLTASTGAIAELNRQRAKQAGQIQQLLLFDEKADDYAAVRLGGKPTWVLFFWSKAQQTELERLAAIIKQFESSHEESVQVADILMDNDTTGWKTLLSRHAGRSWRHLWSPQAVMNPSVSRLAIQSLPTVIVADTTGTVKKRFTNLKSASELE